ncbi:hypothetical protein E2C01_010208 [Portunus trituberculatus]|uniref:Uncharacterized protein n=1 Tax=Portunus trituberculatus TaxID=210409 RepID=A0A5B7D830_PORTR|nr:hypothetical protein [Portunus trituberculatus]
MRFSTGELVFFRLKIISKIANVAEVNEKKVDGDVNTGSTPRQLVDLETFQVPSLEGDSEAGFGVAIFFILSEGSKGQLKECDKYLETSLIKEVKS